MHQDTLEQILDDVSRNRERAEAKAAEGCSITDVNNVDLFLLYSKTFRRETLLDISLAYALDHVLVDHRNSQCKETRGP